MFTNGGAVKFAVAESFRYIHEPLRGDDEAFALLGNADLIGALRSRIRHSHGGAFLITGFRGVGKSTLVLRTLDELQRDSSDGEIVVPVVLSVARSTSIDRLLFAVIRRTFETLNAMGHLERLPAETRHSLLLAYIRTSLSFKETQNSGSEKAAGLELGLGGGLKPVVNVAMPKLNMSVKRSQSLATEASFLAYSETDVEYDLMRIITLLGEPPMVPKARRWRRAVRQPARLHLVIVLDEIDKLTAGDAGLAAIEDLLAGIKNVLSSTGAHFLLVAGTDMHDRALRDASRGNSVYESVFAWRMYVPCVWDAPEELVARLIQADYMDATLRGFVDYLRFKARGVPRRLIQEFNSFIIWENGRPFLNIDGADWERISFYARLQSVLAEHFAKPERRRLFPLAVDNDRRRLGLYYVVDAILRTEREAFSAADLLAEKQEEMGLDPLLRISEGSVDRLLEHLAAQRIIVPLRDEEDASAVVIEDVAGAQRSVYKLADDIQTALFGIAIHSEAERVALELSLPSLTMAPAQEAEEPERRPFARPKGIIAGRYELDRLLGQGGMGLVYKGFDRLFHREVAIKILRPELLQDHQAVARFRREASIASRISHPQIVRTFDSIDDPSYGQGLVMELLPGITLRDRLSANGTLPAGAVAKIGRAIADALDYLEQQGLARIDLKPSNIIMHPTRGPVIIDFGITRQVGHGTVITVDRSLVGTPQYMAPEQILGSSSADIRADIYALGLVLYTALEGRSPWQDLPMASLVYRLTQEDIDVASLPISPEFRSVLGRALARDPEGRYQHPAELTAALLATPELGDDPDDSRTIRIPLLLDGSTDLTRVEPPASPPRCPDCARPKMGRFCETCGYDFDSPASGIA